MENESFGDRFVAQTSAHCCQSFHHWQNDSMSGTRWPFLIRLTDIFSSTLCTCVLLLTGWSDKSNRTATSGGAAFFAAVATKKRTVNSDMDTHNLFILFTN